jgi:hypothetical protein
LGIIPILNQSAIFAGSLDIIFDLEMALVEYTGQFTYSSRTKKELFIARKDQCSGYDKFRN